MIGGAGKCRHLLPGGGSLGAVQVFCDRSWGIGQNRILYYIGEGCKGVGGVWREAKLYHIILEGPL